MKAKNGSGVNGLIFIVAWVLIMSFLKIGLFQFSSTVYGTVADNFPDILQRYWVFMMLQATISGFAIAAAQKLAIQFLSQIRLQYWIRANLIFAILMSLVQFSTARFFAELSIYPILLVAITGFEVLALAFVQWLILRKHFNYAWAWLLVAIPNIILAVLRWQVPEPILIDSLQALFTGIVLIYLQSQNSSSNAKAKNEESDLSNRLKNLANNLDDEGDNLSGQLKTKSTASDN